MNTVFPYYELRSSYQNKEKFVPVNVFGHCDGFMNVADAPFDNAIAFCFFSVFFFPTKSVFLT